MKQQKSPRIRNLSITALIALTGFVSLVVIMAALFIGLWLDSLSGQRGPATILCLVASVPISLYLMLKIALSLVVEIKPQLKNQEVPFNDHSSIEEENP
jgi:magnesium-transporting ATPase (P-type)